MLLSEAHARAGQRSASVCLDLETYFQILDQRLLLQRAKELDFPFMAGSSLPIAWRMPAVDMPYGAEVEEVMCCAYGGVVRRALSV